MNSMNFVPPPHDAISPYSPMIFVSKVFFETGDVGVTETFRVRAGNETVPASERVNTTITVNTDCGALDGVSTR